MLEPLRIMPRLTRGGQPLVPRLVFVTLFSVGLFGPVGLFPHLATAQDSPQNDASDGSENEAALAQYADAANFQTNGELALAIESWKKFLKEFPTDPLAPKAAHYLGVCYMQLPEPNHVAASQAFQRALKGEKFELREESLSNLGWCLFVIGSNADRRDEAALEQSIETYGTLLKENAASRFADRAMFYSAESLYSLGKTKESIASYDRFLTSSVGAKSPLKCDALYAKGVALEDVKQLDQAMAVYQEMLSQCGTDPLAGAVRLRMAEVYVMQQKFNDADKLFTAVIAEGGEDKPRAMLRRAFVLGQLNRADEAAKLYERLIEEFPQSPYSASALMAAAQSYYRAGQLDEAAKRFEQVIASQASLVTATEAAHWLSVMAMRKGQVEQAETIARDQIAQGLDGPYKTLVRIDAAEARSMQNGKQSEALAELKQLLADSPADPLVPRILYIAAFTSLQLGQPQQTLEYTNQFASKYEQDSLASDMRYIAAEANLMAGNVDQAASEYKLLLAGAETGNPQLSLWVLRAANAMFAAGQFDGAIEAITNFEKMLKTPAEKAEAKFLTGSSHLSDKRPEEAIKEFSSGLILDPQWKRNDEMMFRLAAAYLSKGESAAATATWDKVISTYPSSKFANQARYRLAQQASDAGQLDRAIEIYTTLIGDASEVGLRPFALYGKGWALLQQKKHQEAIEPLTELIDQYLEHVFRDDALLARGICYRRLNQNEAAIVDLEAFLAMMPSGINLGHGLYELALMDRQLGNPKAAVTKLEQIRREVVDYPAMDSVIYELAWSLKDAGDDQASTKEFLELTNAYPESPQAAEAFYYVGQQAYAAKKWADAAIAYSKVIGKTEDADLKEKAIYRLGWSDYQQKNFDAAIKSFENQFKTVPNGKLSIDALMMVGECHFGKGDYQAALTAYERAKEIIVQRDGENRKFTDPAEQQVRELVYLHGGQSAAQLEQWKAALEWYGELRKRYPSSGYLSQAFYETGFVYQRMGDDAQAMKFFTETADTFRNESAARARFMMGELYFKQNKAAEAITEFKRVMYGFGADKAPQSIKSWQAKSGFEAGRCAELLIQANQGDKRREAIGVAQRYYQYVLDSHPEDPLAAKSRERMDVLGRL